MGKYGKQRKEAHSILMTQMMDQLDGNRVTKRMSKTSEITDEVAVGLTFTDRLSSSSLVHGETVINQLKIAELQADQKMSTKATARAYRRLMAQKLLVLEGKTPDAAAITKMVEELEK